MKVAQICDHIKTIELYVNFSGISLYLNKAPLKILKIIHIKVIYTSLYIKI